MPRVQITLSLPDGPFTGTPAEVSQNVFDQLILAALTHHQESIMDFLACIPHAAPDALPIINAGMQHVRSMADALKLVRIEDIVTLQEGEK